MDKIFSAFLALYNNQSATKLGKMRERFGPFPKTFGSFSQNSYFYSNLIKKTDLCKKLTNCSPHFSSVQLSIKNQFSEFYHISIHFQPKTPYKKEICRKCRKNRNHSRTCNIYTFRLANKKVKLPQNRDRI